MEESEFQQFLKFKKMFEMMQKGHGSPNHINNQSFGGVINNHTTNHIPVLDLSCLPSTPNTTQPLVFNTNLSSTYNSGTLSPNTSKSIHSGNLSPHNPNNLLSNLNNITNQPIDLLFNPINFNYN